MTQVRRVRRIIRKFDAWTVFKVSAVVWAVSAIAFVLGLVMFWSVVTASGIPQRITDFLIKISLLDAGSAPFANNEQFMRLAVYSAVLLAVLGTGMTTLLAVIYNLVSDVVGGIEVIVLEETLAAGPVPMVQRVKPAPTSSHDQPTEETPVIARR
jgi:hypothetical protein